MTAPARFRQDDLIRAMKAARKAGYPRVRIDLDPASGHIIIDASNDDPLPILAPERRNPLDRILG